MRNRGTVNQLVAPNPGKVRVPKSYKEAIESPEKAQWERAMAMEMKNMEDNEVWKLVDPPPGKRILGQR